MEPNYIKKFLSIVNKTTFRDYLDVDGGSSLSSALEERLRWAQDNEDSARVDEAAFLNKHRASLRSMVATMPIDGEGDWGDDGGIGEEFGGSSLSNPYMAFNMFLDDDEDNDSDEFSEADTLGADGEETQKVLLDDEDTSDAPTPLPGAMDFSHTTKQIDAVTDTPEPLPPRDGPKIGEVAAYRNVSDQQESAYDVVTAEVEVQATPVPRVRRPKREKEADGRHIISGLRDPDRISAIRIIPETANRLRPYLLGALLFAVMPLSYMVWSGEYEIPYLTATPSNAVIPSDAVKTPKEVLTQDGAVAEVALNNEPPAEDLAGDEAGTDEFIDVFNTNPKEAPLPGSDSSEAPESSEQGEPEVVDIFGDDEGAEAPTPAEKKEASKTSNSSEPVTAEAQKKADAAAKRKAEAKRKEEEARKAEEERQAKEKAAAQQTLVIGGGTAGTGGNSGAPSFTGSWKGKLGGQTCVFKVSDQSGVTMRGSLKCISASSGENYNMDVKGRYNSSKNSIYFQEVAGAGGWLRASVDRDRMWGNGSPHSGALKQVFSFTR